jgi:hypothetical protein
LLAVAVDLIGELEAARRGHPHGGVVVGVDVCCDATDPTASEPLAHRSRRLASDPVVLPATPTIHATSAWSSTTVAWTKPTAVFESATRMIQLCQRSPALAEPATWAR